MENKEKIYPVCTRCRYYKAFYFEGTSAFYREKAGYCEVTQKTVRPEDSCERYKYRLPRDKNVTLEFLDEVIAAVAELEHIFYRFDS